MKKKKNKIKEKTFNYKLSKSYRISEKGNKAIELKIC